MKTLKPVRANVGVQLAYQRRLEAAVREMANSVQYWLRAGYRAKPPEMAQDASPAVELQRLMARLSRRWQRKFDVLSEELADIFAKSASERTDRALMAALRKGGFTVKFKATRAQNDAFQAIVNENVGLIRSIASEYLDDVQGELMRSVAKGQDVGTMAQAIEARHGVTARRAALIARDQNNKATAVMERVRQTELGITKARWRHSAGGKHPRPEHVAWGREGKIYDVKEGMLQADGKRVWPGTEINCRCFSEALIPGLDADA